MVAICDHKIDVFVIARSQDCTGTGILLKGFEVDYVLLF